MTVVSGFDKPRGSHFALFCAVNFHLAMAWKKQTKTAHSKWSAHWALIREWMTQERNESCSADLKNSRAHGSLCSGIMWEKNQPPNPTQLNVTGPRKMQCRLGAPRLSCVCRSLSPVSAFWQRMWDRELWFFVVFSALFSSLWFYFSSFNWCCCYNQLLCHITTLPWSVEVFVFIPSLVLFHLHNSHFKNNRWNATHLVDTLDKICIHGNSVPNNVLLTTF